MILSIVMPVYNVEKYISSAIESVLSLSFSSWELIIIIDGSPDDSLSIAKKYEEKDSRIKVFTKNNGGLSDARNYGISKATGDYLMFLDSDDTINDFNLSELIHQQPLYDVYIFSYRNITATVENEILSLSVASLFDGKWSRGEQASHEIIEKNLRFLNFAWNKIYNASFIHDNQLSFTKGLSLIEDIDFNSRVYKKANSLKFVDVPLVNYYSRPINTLSLTYRKDLVDLLVRRQNLYSGYFQNFDFPSKKRAEHLAKISISDFQYFFHMLTISTLSRSEKLKLLKSVVSDKVMQKNMKFVDFENYKSYLLFILIKLKSIRLLSVAYHL